MFCKDCDVYFGIEDHDSDPCDKCGYSTSGSVGCTHPTTVTRNDDTYHFQMCTSCWIYIQETYEEHSYDKAAGTGKCTGCDYACTHGGKTEGVCETCGYTLNTGSGHTHTTFRYEEARRWT